MVDETKAVLIGQADQVITELAFLMDKLCMDTNKSSNNTYEDMHELLLARVKYFRDERENGVIHNHPHEDPEDSLFDKKEDEKKAKSNAAEAALQEALKEIKAMRDERIQQSSSEKPKKIKKVKKSKKKDA